MNTAITTPMKLEIRPIGPKPLNPKLLPNRFRTKSSSETATKPNIDATTILRNLSPTWVSQNLYAASVPPKAARVPSTAPKTIETSPLAMNDTTTLEKAPTNRPSRAAYASTRAGLTTFLNELTIDRTKPPRPPTRVSV